MNVVARWRERPRELRGEYWRCGSCGRFAGVLRVACTQCGNAMKPESRSALPRSVHALEASHAQSIVETMDQVSDFGAVMLVDVGGGQLFALPLCETDAQHGKSLIGETLELVLRRKACAVERDMPIPYGRKLAAGAATRLRLKKIQIGASKS